MEFLNFNDERCIDILNKGDVLLFPTETVYGMGARYDIKRGFDRLVEIKKRPPTKPFTLMISNIEQIKIFADLNENINRVINKFFPGELTLILKSKTTYHWVTLGFNTIGIRMSSSSKVIDLINRVGVPLLVTSVNKSSRPPLNKVDDIVKEFKDENLNIVIDDAKLSEKPSTIVSIIENDIKLIREGNIKFDDILDVWRKNL